MLLTNWLTTLTSRIKKRPTFRSRDRRAIRRRWQTATQNQITTAEVLEDRTLLTTFFVDDDYTGMSFNDPITDIDPVTAGDQAGNFGIDVFATIQGAVNAAAAGDTIYVSAGTYSEDVIVNTSVFIQGANSGIAVGVDPGVRGLESELTGGFRLFANDVVIDGFKIIDGTGPAGIGSKSAVFMASGTTGHTIENSILEGPGTGVESRGVLTTFNGNNDNITIQNNEIYNWRAGIHNQGNSNVDIFGNNIHDVVAGVANDYVTDVSIEGNAFSNSLEGIGVFNNTSNGIPDVAAHNNFFDSSTLTNPIAHYGGDTVDASGNWWGSMDETTIANSMKSDGVDGDTSKVDFTSFLNNGTDTDGLTAGFQGDFSTLNVTTLGAQTGSAGRIQEAIDSVNSGGTVNILAGTFNENVNVDKSVTLDGAGIGSTLVGGSGNIFTVTAGNVLFQDMTLQDAAQGIRVDSVVDNLQIDNLSFEGILSGAYGIEIHNSAVLTNLSVVNSFFSGTGGTGIRMASTAVADGIHVNNTEFDGLKNAINEASNNTVAGGHLRDLQVTNSTFQNISDVSIYAEDLRDSNISGNEFFGNPAGNGERDIVLNNKYSANGMAFGNIQITNNSFSNSDRPAIQLDSRAEALVGGVTISGNSFDSDISTLTYSWTRIDVNLNSSYTHAPVAITDNSITFTGNSSAGSTGTSAISLSGGSDAITISGNTLTDNTTLGGYSTTGIAIITDNSFSGAISSTAVIDISNNFIDGFDTAVLVYDSLAADFGGLTAGAQINFNNNSVTGSTANIASGAGTAVNASNNWWGSNVEATVASLIAGNVDFTSYLDNGTDTDAGTAGFQGDFNVVNVTALGEQTGPLSRIQEAIEALNPGGTINIASGTYAGNVDATATGIDKSVKLVPGSSPGQVVIAGDLKLDGNDIVDVEVNGTIAGTEYDQFIVNGDLALGGATLNLIDGFDPADGDRFTLIQNNGINPVSGTFFDYPEGHEFTNFLGSGLNAYLTYVGGDGNDVVILMEDSTPEVTLPVNGTTDNYSLEIDGTNVVIRDVATGDLISSIPLDSLEGTLIINGEAGVDDKLTIDMTGIDETTDLQVIFNGGTGGHDTLELVNGNLNSIEFRYVDPSTGSIRLNGSGSDFISYTGLEPVTSTVNATNVTLTYTGGAEIIDISDLGGGQTRVDSSLGEMTDFINPTGTLTINAGTGADTININSLAAGYSANIIINGDGAADEINVDASISLAAGKTIQFNAEVVELTGDVTADAITGTATTVNITGSAGGAEIQDAIDLAASGATINVAAGTYAEDVIVDRSVILQGANAGIAGNGVRGAESLIDPSSPFGIEVRADDVTIDGFEITGLNRDGINVRPTNSGPGVSTRGNIVIQNNYIHETFVPGNQINGIVFGEKVGGGPDSTDAATISFVTIADNLIDVTDDNTARGIVMTGQFASIHYDNFDITGNVIQAKNNGLFFAENPAIYTAAGIEILDNTFESPGSTGINAGNLDSTSKVNGNTFINNASGAALNFAEPGGEVLNNIFENNTNVGLYFFDDTYFPQSSENPTVTGNTFTNNGRQVGGEAPAVDLDAIQNNNSLDGNVKVSSNNNLYGHIQDAIDDALPGDVVTVVLNVTYTENVDVNQAVTLMGEATVDGSVTASVAGATIAPGFSPGTFTSTDLILTAGSSLNVEIDGLSGAGVTGGHDQYVTTGNVNLGGATLDTTGSDIVGATLGDTFEIIDVGGTLTGTFAGLDNGDSVLVNGQTFRIFYNGGDGNDVVLTFLPPVPITYVDTAFTGVNGTFITDADPNQGGDQNAVIGVNAFNTIQGGIDGVVAVGTVIVNAGTYVENITLSKQVDLLGVQAGVDARGRGGTLDDSLSSIIAPASGTGLDLQSGSAGSTIDGFTFSGGTTGIVSTTGLIDDLQILNNQFVGFTGSGVFLNNSGDDITVHQNVIDGTSQAGGGGIFHLDQDTFDGFHFTSNWVLNGDTGFFVDGTRNVSSSANRDPLFEDNLFDGNGAGANFGRFGVENAVVQNNVFSNNAFDGLQGGIQNSLITSNTFDTNARAGLRLTGFGGTGDSTRGAQGNIVEENIFLNNGAGMSGAGYGDVRLDDQYDGTISTNAFFNNSFGSTVAVFNNETSGEVVDFSGNWWATNDDDAVVLKLDGAGAGAVDFTSFLDDGTDQNVGLAGFQGDFSTLNVTSLGSQTGLAGRIQEAIANVTAGGTVNILSGTYAGNVDATGTGINKNVTLAPGNSPGQVVINGDLILNGDDFLDIEINGQTAGSGYDQFIVNGAVVLNSAALNLTNTYTPVDGDKFTLIDNDAADGITGEFVGYPEGHVFTNFLGSGLNAYLTYVGGDGNDVVIHMVDSTPEITVPNNGTADQYTLRIVGGNFVLSETVSGTIISTFPVAAINGPLVINGENDQDDTLTIDLDTIDHTTDIQIEFRGGTGGNDALILERTGAINSVEHVFTSASDGSVFLDGEAAATITYTGLEPIIDTITATNRIFSYTGAAETITLADDGDAGDGESQINSTLGESVNFVHPTGTLTINTEVAGGSGADTVIVNAVDSTFTANLTVNAGNDDTLTLAGPTNIGSGNADLNAGQVNVNGTFTTSGTVDVDANDQITFAAASIIDATANTIDLTAGNNIQLGQITTSGDVTVTATAGAISDANAGNNNITANQATLTAGAGAGVGDALETALGFLEGNISGGLELAELNGIVIGNAGGINGLTVSGNTTITAGAGLVVNENLAVTGGALQLSNASGNFDVGFGAIISNDGSNLIEINSAGLIVMTDTGTQITSSGNGTIDLDAAVHILLTNVNTSGEVQVTAAGGQIFDNTAGESPVITANTAALRAATGIGDVGAGDFDLAINTMAADTTNGDIFIQEPSAATIGTVDSLDGITAAGNISLSIGGTLNINQKIEATGAASIIQANVQGDINVNSTVQTNGGGINLYADDNLALGATSLVDTTTAELVRLIADFNSDSSGGFTQDEGSLVNARGGDLVAQAYGDVEIADLQSAGGRVVVTSLGGGVVDNTTSPSEAPLITASGVAFQAAGSVGGAGDADIDTAVSTLSASATSGDVVVSNTGALIIGDVIPLSGVLATNGSVTVSASSPLTVASNVSASGTVTLTSTDGAGPGDDLTINAGVTVQSTGADVVLNSGDDFLLSLTGEVIAATTITINIDPITDGAGATVDLLGNVNATQTTINGGDDSDIFNILPTVDSPITVNGGDPTLPGPGDVLNLDFSGLAAAPALTLGGDPGSGQFSFLAPDTEQAVNYTSIEDVNTNGSGSYHLVLDMFFSGFEDASDDTIDVGLDAGGTNLLIDINGSNFFTGNDADILSFTVLGSADNDTLNINETAGGLPFFATAAPGGIPGSNGAHLNLAAETFLEDEFAPNTYDVNDITIHYDGKNGTDAINVNFITDHNAGYFSDTIDGLGSGNIGASAVGDTDIDLGLSFGNVEGVGFSGAANGGLRVDASSTPATTGLNINDDSTPADGVSQITGNGGFTALVFEGFNDLQVVSGTGAELIDLIALDSATTLTSVELDADDVFAADDVSNDTIRVRSTPAGVTSVSLLGGLGDDLFQIFDAGSTVDNIFAALTVDGEDGVDTLTVIDSGDATGDTFEVTSTTIEGISSSAGTDVTFANIDDLNVTGTAGDDTINVNLGLQEDLDTVTINGAGGDDDFNLQNSTPVGVNTLLNGQAGNDEFFFDSNYVLRGFINGGGDVDTIDYTTYSNAVHVQLVGLGSLDGFQGYELNGSILGTGGGGTGFDNINDLVGSANSDTLEGPNLNNYWGITANDEGFIIAERNNLASGRPTIAGDAIATPPEERLDFTDFQNLIGGTQDDRFDLSDGAGLTGTLDGDTGNDSLDYRDYTTGVTVDLFAGTATNIGGGLVAGTGGGDDDNSIENVFGGDGNDNITGDNDHNILGDGLGSDNLDGGGYGVGSGNGGNDVFLMEPGAGGSADVITDIHGNDTVDFRFASAGIVFDVDIINTPQDVFGGNTVELRQLQPEQPDTNPSFMENVVGSEFDDYIFIDPLSQDGNFPIDGPPVLRSADGRGGFDILDFDAKGQAVIDTGYSLTADGVGTVQYLNFEEVTPFEDNPATIVDNGDLGFSLSGDWPYHPAGTAAITTGVGYEDDIHTVPSESTVHYDEARAFWEFYGLTPGVYRVSVTWPASENPFVIPQMASDAPFTVFDGSRNDITTTAINLGTFDLNQQIAPDDFQADGALWEDLGTFTINSRTLTVMLTNLANGLITADAVRIERVSAGPEVQLTDVTDAPAPPSILADGHPGGIDFGTTELLTDLTRTFEITNSGSAALDISNIVIPAGFTTTLTAQSVAAGDTISFEITMDSNSFGDRSGLFSFDTNDVDEATFNLLLHGQVSNVVIIDNGDADFSATPGFELYESGVNRGSAGFEGDIAGAIPNQPGFIPPPAGTDTATWTFTGLANGFYRVSTTWSALYNRVTDAPYTVTSGGNTFSLDVNQTLIPSSFADNGAAWFDLNTFFEVVDGTLTVTLTNDASSIPRDTFDLANGVIADAVRIEYLPTPDLEVTVDGNVVDDDTGVVDFGTTIPGIPVSKTFTVTNLSADPVDVTGLIEFPPGFSIDPASPFGTDTVPVNIPGGGSVTFTIQFDGGTTGSTFGQISFTTGDADENPYNFTVTGAAGPATVGINDGDFTSTGTWNEHIPGVVGDPEFLYTGVPYVGGSGANTASWEFDVEPGRYQIVGHWYVHPDVSPYGRAAATNAPYTIFSDATPVDTFRVSHQTSSNDFLDDGTWWEYIGDPVEIDSNILRVLLSDDADGIVYADEIRIIRVVDPVIKVEVDGGTVEDSGAVDFEDTITGAPVVKTFTVTNFGERNMALGGINVPTGFSLVSGFGNTNLAPGASTTFTLQMDASVGGSFSGMVSFGGDLAVENPFNFAVSGSAADSMIIDNGDPDYSTSGAAWNEQVWTFGDDTLYFQRDQDVLLGGDLPGVNTATWTFDNLGAGTYQVATHWLNHSGYASNAQITIAGIEGGPITVTLDQRFYPQGFSADGSIWQELGNFQVAAGNTLTVTISDDGANGNLAADAMRLELLTPGSTAPEIDVAAGAMALTSGVSSIDLGTAFFGETLSQTFTITNTGTNTLNLGAITLPGSGEYTVSSPLGTTTLFAGQSTTFEISFTSTGAAGVVAGLVEIATNDSDENPFTFNITAEMTDVVLIDNGDVGYSSTGSWTNLLYDARYFESDAQRLNLGQSGTATWDFTNLTAGTYTVSATWLNDPLRATNAEYNVAGVGPVVVNQRIAPNDFAADGFNWEILTAAVVVTPGGSITVTLSDNGPADGAINADAIRIQRVGPLMAAAGVSSTAAPSITQSDLDSVVDAALSYWETAGLSDAQLELLGSVNFVLTDLPDAMLGGASGTTVLIDVNAAGYGWFVDGTPLDSSEFTLLDGSLLAGSGSDAFGQMDLLTVVMHELGHTVGLEDLDSDGTLMSESLDVSERRLPSADDLDDFFSGIAGGDNPLLD